MFENKERTSLEELGEFGLIDHLAQYAPTDSPSTLLGIGDDAAVIKSEDQTSATILTTDFLVESVHFDLAYTPLKHLGYKAVMANLSDVYAMNGIPSQITVSIALSSKFTLEAIEELYAGIYAACNEYNVDVVGGDTTSSLKGLIISITAIGRCDPDKITKRSGAKEGDLLCVSGDLGGAYMGLQLLEREKRVFIEHPEMQPDLEMHDYIVGRQLKPAARKDVIDFFAENGIIPTSMIDVSDGLSSEIFHLSKHSKVSFAVHEDKLPIDQGTYDLAVEFGIDPTTAALNGGEDYELLFTLDQKDFDKIKGSLDISVIGYAREIHHKNQLISKQGNIHDLIAQGWKFA